jgi:type IV pilus assembly protein PilC
MDSTPSLSLKARLFRPQLLVKAKYLCIFTRQLSTMLDAGLAIVTSLRTLAEQCDGVFRLRHAREALRQIVSEVEAGAPMSEAMARQPQSFGQLYVSMIRAGEVSGAMNKVLERLAEYMERTEKFKKKIISSLIYPTVVMSVAIGITLMLMIFVVPQFIEIFSDLLEGQPMPALTLMVMGFSNLITHYFLYMVLAVGALAFAFVRWRKTKKGKFATDLIMIKTPPLSSLVLKISVSRFCSTLSTLLEAGVPVLSALRIVEETSTNELVKQTVESISASVSEGEGISKPLEASKLFPIMVVRLMEVGEQTGSLPKMLERISAQYESEVDDALEALVSLIEPLMIVFLAVVVGTVVIALFMPLISIIETLG